jgi:OMF family outer membrane factor
LANLREQTAVVIANATLQRNTAAARIQTADDQVGWAQTIYQQTVLQQEQGTANLTDVLLADNALRETQQNYLSAVVDYLKADLELKKATQSLIR